jgi:hypothetical protein
MFGRFFTKPSQGLLSRRGVVADVGRISASGVLGQIFSGSTFVHIVAYAAHHVADSIDNMQRIYFTIPSG